MKSLLFSALAIALFAFTIKDKLTGQWESPVSVKGNVTRVVFKDDGTFTGFINTKPFVTGNYTLKDSLFTFTDNGCNGMQGVYKAVFFSGEDSVRFVAVTDECIQRKGGMERIVLGRVKELQYQ
jgi:hypothetical protein